MHAHRLIEIMTCISALTSFQINAPMEFATAQIQLILAKKRMDKLYGNFPTAKNSLAVLIPIWLKLTLSQPRRRCG